MRIAIDARPLRHATTGIGRYTERIVQGMQDADQDLILLGHDRPVPASAPGRLSEALWSQAVLGKAARRARADVYWSPRHNIPFGLGSTPSVVTIHDLVWRRAPETMERGRRLLESRLMRFAVNAARRIIAVSESTRADLIEEFPHCERRVHVVYPGTDPPAPPGRSAHPRPYILFVGTLEPRKNLSRVIDAYARLASVDSTFPDLLIAGNPGWKSTEVTRRLEHPDLQGRVIPLGRVTDEVLSHLYACALFVVAPSLYEGFGLQILEAMRHGTPVITADRSSMPEVAGDAGILVDPTSTLDIAGAMARLAEDGHLRRRLSEAGRVRASQFSWQAATDRTIEILTLASSSD